MTNRHELKQEKQVPFPRDEHRSIRMVRSYAFKKLGHSPKQHSWSRRMNNGSRRIDSAWCWNTRAQPVGSHSPTLPPQHPLCSIWRSPCLVYCSFPVPRTGSGMEQAMTYCDGGHCVTEKSAHNICSPTLCSLFCSLDWSVWLVLANRLWVEMPCVTSRTGRLRALRFLHLSLPSLQETLETLSWFTYRRTLNLWVIREIVLPHWSASDFTWVLMDYPSEISGLTCYCSTA